MNPYRKAQTWLPEIIFNDLFNEYHPKTVSLPALNIAELENGFRVELAIPGVSKENVKVEINKENQLVISSVEQTEPEEKQEEKQERYLRKEFGYSEFVKTLSLPEDVDKEAVAASFENGILTVSIPRKEKDPAEETKSIAIA
jgi:HSP20 family protein